MESEAAAHSLSVAGSIQWATRDTVAGRIIVLPAWKDVSGYHYCACTSYRLDCAAGGGSTSGKPSEPLGSPRTTAAAVRTDRALGMWSRAPAGLHSRAECHSGAGVGARAKQLWQCRRNKLVRHGLCVFVH